VTTTQVSTKGAPLVIQLDIEDEASHTRPLSLRMSLDEFAKAITGSGNCDAEAHWCLGGFLKVVSKEEFSK